MVFHRRSEPAAAPQPLDPAAMLRRNDRAAAAHLSQVPGATSESVIGNDLTIEGQQITIRCQGSLRVNGNIQADLHSREIEVGKEAAIQGAVAADTVNVYGRVNGAILGTKVVLHASAEVEGDIHSEYLSIEQGATFDGRSRKVKDPSEIAPQLVRTSQAAPSQPSGIQNTDRNTGPQPFGSGAAAGLVN